MTSAFDLCSRAWQGRKGYVCLAVRDQRLEKHSAGYWRDLLFRWPEDTPKIKAALRKSRDSEKDVYFAPAVFSEAERAKELVTNTNSLWADLDEIDPRSLPPELKPTAAWQSSPGRYQALWELEAMLHPAVQQQLNQRLTYAIGADKGGWDLTQVLRIPGTHNHKYEDGPSVKLLWLNGHKVNGVKLLNDLPEANVAQVDGTALEKVPSQADVLKRFKIPPRVKELIKAKHTSGDRSARLWELECLLAEIGMNEEDIVGTVMPTVWNKFKDRHDELTRLTVEARKAIEHAAVQIEEEEDEEGVDPEDVEGPQSWIAFDAEHQPITWMVADIWGESEVGFISGQPKSYKSWLALDLAVSVATGTRFLGSYQTRKHNVLLIQEEDPKPVLQERLAMVGGAKGLIDLDIGKDSVAMTYDLPDNLFIISNQGFTINDEWLAMLEQWIVEREIKLVILDPLMMMGENFDEFKAFEVMGKILKPLKRLRSRTNTAIVVVHHHTKGTADAGAKAMYGSVALWAWEEAALHLQVVGVGKVVAERFSKHALLPPITIEIGELSDEWSPSVGKLNTDSLYDVLSTMDAGATIEELVTFTGIGREAVDRQLKQFEKDEKAERAGTRKSGAGRPSTVWKVKS